MAYVKEHSDKPWAASLSGLTGSQFAEWHWLPSKLLPRTACGLTLRQGHVDRFSFSRPKNNERVCEKCRSDARARSKRKGY